MISLKQLIGINSYSHFSVDKPVGSTHAIFLMDQSPNKPENAELAIVFRELWHNELVPRLSSVYF